LRVAARAPTRTFKDLWDAIAGAWAPTATLDAYCQTHARASLLTLYRDFLHASMFNSDYPGPIDLPGMFNTVGDLVAESTLTIAADGTMTVLWTKPLWQASDPRPSVVVAVEFPSGIPGSVSANVYRYPTPATPVPGGLVPAATFTSASVEPVYQLVRYWPRDELYVTVFGTVAGATVPVRLSQIGCTISPAALTKAEPNRLYNFQADIKNVPQCVGPVSVEWDFGDDSDPYYAHRSQVSSSYTVSHRFPDRGSDQSYAVTFELRDRLKDHLLAQGTCPVGILTAPPSFYIVPAGNQVTVGALVDFELRTTNPPGDARYVWNFSDDSSSQTTTGTELSRLFASAGSHTVSVAMYSAADMNNALARNSASVTVIQPANSSGLDHECVPDAGIDYTKLRKVVEAEMGGGTNVYYVDANGRRHGLFHTFYLYDDARKTYQTEVCGLYVHGVQEGRWMEYWQDDTAIRREVHYLGGLRDGPDLGWESDGTQMWEQHWIHEHMEGDSIMFGLGPAGESYFPEQHLPDGEYTEEISDETGAAYESCPFVDNLRHGTCTRRYESSSGSIEQQGTYTNGEKTGLWQYTDSAGTTVNISHGTGR